MIDAAVPFLVSSPATGHSCSFWESGFSWSCWKTAWKICYTEGEGGGGRTAQGKAFSINSPYLHQSWMVSFGSFLWNMYSIALLKHSLYCLWFFFLFLKSECTEDTKIWHWRFKIHTMWYFSVIFSLPQIRGKKTHKKRSKMPFKFNSAGKDSTKNEPCLPS